MAALSLMPIWAFMYVRSLTEAPQTVEGPMAIGDEVYSNCSSCHGGSGEGGTGRPLANGEVNKTFPHIEDQLRFVYFGTEGYNSAGVSIYGDPNREGGAHTTGSFGLMPAWGTNAGGDLTDAEILGVVCHERYAFGVDPAADEATAKEFGLWCAENSPMLAALEAGTPLADLDEAGITGPDGAPVGDHRHRRRSRRGPLPWRHPTRRLLHPPTEVDGCTKTACLGTQSRLRA